MKTFNKTYLVESIDYNGETYKVNARISGAMEANSTSPNFIQKQLNLQGVKSILVKVLSNNLKGRKDLWGNLYKPSVWIYTNKKIN